MLKVAVVGGTGYTGLELLRLLAKHPQVELSIVTSRSQAGQRVDHLFSNLRGHLRLTLGEPDISRLSACDLVFFATPNGTAMTMVAPLLDAGVRVIDLAADFRLRSAADWERWYGKPHACAELLERAVYGLPELNREAIRAADLVANPGCYPTAVLLGFLPLIERHVIDPGRLTADVKSGISGAGRVASTRSLYAEAADSLTAYGVPGHRHLPEIIQGLRLAGGRNVDVLFVPHLTPMIRGIHATLYAELNDGNADLQSIYQERYRDEPFVDVMPPGSHPETRSVRGANVCRVAVHRPQTGRRVVVLSVIDNLLKGAAGQAIQNMNIMFGFTERSGLEDIALQP